MFYLVNLLNTFKTINFGLYPSIKWFKFWTNLRYIKQSYFYHTQISDQNTTLCFLTFIKPSQIQTTLKKIKHFHWSLVQYYSTICTVATKSSKHKSNTLKREPPFSHPTFYWTRKQRECYRIQENSRVPFHTVCEPQSNSAREATAEWPKSFPTLLLPVFVQLLHKNKRMEVDQTLHWAIYGN